MDARSLFLLESLVSLALSLAIIRYLRDVMHSLLEAAFPQGVARLLVARIVWKSLVEPAMAKPGVQP